MSLNSYLSRQGGKTPPSVHEMLSAADAAAEAERASEAGARAVAQLAEALGDDVDALNLALEREVAVDNVLGLVLRQLGFASPTLKAAQARRDIVRIVHDLYEAPGAAITLTVQSLGEGFAKPAGLKTPVEVAALEAPLGGLTAAEYSRLLEDDAQLRRASRPDDA